MLILRRKTGESLAIGEEITVTVLDINEGSVRLAIDAPKSITILRSELLQAADANRDAAAGRPPAAGLLKREPAGRRAAARPVRVRAPSSGTAKAAAVHHKSGETSGTAEPAGDKPGETSES